MSHFLPQEKLLVKEIDFLSKLHISFDMWLSKIKLFRAKYLSKTTIFQHNEKLYPTQSRTPYTLLNSLKKFAELRLKIFKTQFSLT